MSSRLETWEVSADIHFEVGFDHENLVWNPSYLCLNKYELLASGKGKTYPTGSSVVVRAYTMFPEKVCRVTKRYLELTGERPYFYFDCIELPDGVRRRDYGFHVYASFYDGNDRAKWIAMNRAFEEAWDENTPISSSID